MSSTKNIAKNSMFLYFRMFLTMGVGLYTSRLVLEALGVVDYGIYGLVGGIVSMFSFLNSAMSAATQRYLSFDIGKGDCERLKKTFNATLNIHILIAAIILVLAETIGLWFVNYQLDIPAERMYAANWVYQFSIFTFILGVIQVPYNALLIAREHMNVYAYMSILESVLKLVTVLILVSFGNDKLILYAVLTFVVSFLIRTLYKIYCKKYFRESQYEFYYDKSYYKELLSYSGWNLFGSISVIFRGQGSNILLNLFFGPIANAAYSITLMVQGIIGNFVYNFQTALNPQITKRYAKGDIAGTLRLMYYSTKYSFFGLLVILVPLYINLEYLMKLWLQKIPENTIAFIKISLITVFIDSISNIMAVGVQATGNIKKYQVMIGFIIMSVLPITYLFFYIFNSPVYLYWILVFNAFIALIFRIVYMKKVLEFSLSDFFKNAIKPMLITGMFILFSCKVIDYISPQNFLDFVFQYAEYTIIILFIIILFGLNNQERSVIIKFIKSKIRC